jgi:hypothetical protein
MNIRLNRAENLTMRQGLLAFLVISMSVLTFCGFVVASSRTVEMASQVGWSSIILLTVPLAILNWQRAVRSADQTAIKQIISHAAEIIVGAGAFWMAPFVFRLVWGAGI